MPKKATYGPKGPRKIIRTARRLFKPEATNRLWELDTTYVRCSIDGRCYGFNVIDCFARTWVLCV